MRWGIPRTVDSRHGRKAAAAVVVLAVSGVACIGLALAGHWRPTPPEPPLTQASPTPASVRSGGTPSPHASPAPRAALVMRASAPLALDIPTIGVKTSLVRVGVSTDGALEVPTGSHYDQAAWFRYSPTPGSLGPAVIVGHIDSVNGASVFFRLGSLGRGDLVRVTRADHSVAVFEVDDIGRYHKTQFPTQLVYGNTDHAALRLISCGGPFDRDTGHYRDNIVVRASLIRSE